MKNNYTSTFLLVTAFFIYSFQSVAQCPSASRASFDWDTDGSNNAIGNEWSRDLKDIGDSQNYTLTNGNGETVTMTLTLTDDTGANVDNNYACPFGNNCDNLRFGRYTETNGSYGLGYLTWALGTTQASDKATFTFSFSRPINLDHFSIGDIDDIGGSTDPETYIDAVTLAANHNGTNVPLNLSGGSNIDIQGQTATAIYSAGNDDMSPSAIQGTLNVQSSNLITSLSVTYFNNDSDNKSNGQAIRINGDISFCLPPSGSAVSGSVMEDTDDNGTGDTPIPGTAIQLIDEYNNVVATTTTDAYGYYYFAGVSAGIYTIVEQDLGNFTSVSDIVGDNDNTIQIEVIANQIYSGLDYVDKRIPPQLTVNQTANVQDAVNVGDLITYTVDISNFTENTIDNVTLANTLPNGVSYVDGTAAMTYPTGSDGQCGQLTKQLSPTPTTFGGYYTGKTTASQSVTVDAGDNIPSGAVLQSVVVNNAGTTNGQAFLSRIAMKAYTPSGLVDSRDQIGDGMIGGQPWNYNSGTIPASGTVEGEYRFDWSYIENTGTTGRASVNSAEVTINWCVPSSRAETSGVANDSPDNFVSTANAISLMPNETLTVSYQVRVDDVQAAEAAGFVNTASATSDQTPVVEGTHTIQMSTSPVSILNFQADYDGNEVEITWATSQETNNSHFELMRSDDADGWKSIAVIDGNGTTSTRSSYQYRDRKLPSTKTAYYQLRQVDYDGKSTLSNIIAVSLPQNMARSTFYPNPVIDHISIDESLHGNSFEILDQMGRSVLLGKVEDNTSIDISELNTGVYHLIIHKTNQKITERLVKL